MATLYVSHSPPQQNLSPTHGESPLPSPFALPHLKTAPPLTLFCLTILLGSRTSPEVTIDQPAKKDLDVAGDKHSYS
jgi:hypothetical protein